MSNYSLKNATDRSCHMNYTWDLIFYGLEDMAKIKRIFHGGHGEDRES